MAKKADKDKTDLLTPVEAATIRFYDDTASKWIGVHAEKEFWSDQMDKFRDYLPNGRIVDLGCGSGRDVGELARRGYQCIGIDLSEGMLSHARRQNPSLNFCRMNLYRLGFQDRRFDGFWSAASLLHIPKTRLNEVILEITRVTNLGGIGFIAVREEEKEAEECEENQLTSDDTNKDSRKIFFYNKDEMAGKLADNGFKLLSWHRRPRGDLVNYLCYYVKIV